MLFYDFCHCLFTGLFKVWLRLEVRGIENIPQEGPLVVAANHLSLFDPPVVGTAANRQVNFMAKSELFKPLIFGWVIRQLGAFPVQRGGADRGAIKHSLDLLKAGGVVGVFPEGTRSKTGDLGRVGSGAFMIGAKTKANILPVYIYGTDTKRHAGLWPKVIVSFGKPLAYDREAPANKENLEIINEKWTEAVLALRADLEKSMK